MKYADIPVEITAGEFTNTWDSLKQYQCPEWFRDAKFGVWAHWGPQSVPIFLLSIPLRPDGTIDKKEEQIIADITAWMSVNGEAIYDTRPYEHYGEGPSADAADAAKGKLIQELACTERDFRFTKRGRVLYAVCLKAPQTPQLLLRSLDCIRGRVEAVSVLGDASCAEWHWEENGLSVRYHLPEGKVPLHTVKIVLKNEI